ncbi:MAG: UrcA family protein [Sphingobium phenoxybenzoativorans]|uniref:UrcA family protein n=1 Tax=Sphingobium phenoxybenzoativorans TaxID=1592790 RepID=A0A975K872_9SPHN|nr:UrcA family protein [Sphingobium phenoxybenzoativorans]QUT06169.1 UrcA family protein [Sphingobium phenoxybenzoativorans]
MHRKTILAAAAAALFIPAAASAQQVESDVIVTGDRTEEVRSVVVSLRDLDLRADRDVRVADARIRRAANKVCDDTPGSSLIGNQARCVNEAFGNARVDLNSAVYAVRAG